MRWGIEPDRLTLRIHRRLDEIPADAWNALAGATHPFVRHEFLCGLERHGCVREALGWSAHHVALWRGDELVAATPCYLKSNSHGEFVFDFAWAQAYERVGLDYYPKLLSAVPYSPITGPRLLVAPGAPADARSLLVEALTDDRFSSAHANFLRENDDQSFAAAGWLARGDWQFHWENRGWPCFDAFLAALSGKRRKAIRQERAKIAREGYVVQMHEGASLTHDDLDFAYLCYARTFAEKGNYPALTRAFFGHLAEAMPRELVIAFASRERERVAMALFLRGERTLYGRYWGATQYVPGLHFECCYYAGIEYCLANGIARFEPGAQGEHKLPRGFLPQRTYSRHWIADERMRAAIARSLDGEARWLERHGRLLAEHSPYREGDAP